MDAPVRETDPVKRESLHAIRSLLDVAQKALALAGATAVHASDRDLAQQAHALGAAAYEMELAVVDRLTTNQPTKETP